MRRAIIDMAPSLASLLLIVAGLALLTAAAWDLARPAGLAAAGLSCLIVHWCTMDSTEDRREDGRR